MKKTRKSDQLLEQNSFLKGLMIGIGSTVLFAGIGAVIAYQFQHLRREASKYNKKLSDYSSEGKIVPDSGISTSANPKFIHESEELEKDFEIRQKEFEEIEEATKNLRDRI